MELFKQQSFRSSFKQIFSSFNYFYLFVIVIYCGMASPITQNLRGYTGYPLGFIFPLVLTTIFIIKNNVRLTKKALYLLCGYFIWFFIQHIKLGSSNLSLTFFMFYQLVIAYSLVYVFRKNLLVLFENIIYILACICLVTWCIGLLYSNIFDLFAGLSLPTSSNIIKYNFIFFSVLDRAVDTGTFYRNPGFLWESGVYSCYLCVAILSNFLINGYKGNKRLYILLLSLITTFSTTGYLILVCALLPLYICNKKTSFLIRTLWIIIPSVIFLFNLDFMNGKIQDLQTNEDRRTEIVNSIDFGTKHGQTYVYVPQRFDGLAFEWLNILSDPIIGYGVNINNSFINKSFGERLSLSNGLLKLYAQFGIVFGTLLTVLFFMSFKSIFETFKKKGYVFAFMIYLLISVSYPFFNIPIILSFLFYYLIPKQSILQR